MKLERYCFVVCLIYLHPPFEIRPWNPNILFETYDAGSSSTKRCFNVKKGIGENLECLETRYVFQNAIRQHRGHENLKRIQAIQ